MSRIPLVTPEQADDPVVREVYVVNQKVALRLLERLGYQADVAANDLEVLEALRRQEYDVVLMDVQMPEMDGVEATRRIREEWPVDRQPRIVAMTAHALTGDRERLLEAGMDDYISKPVKVDQLVAALERCHPRAEKAVEAGPGASPDTHSPVEQQILARLREALGQEAEEILAELIDTFLTDADRLLDEIRDAVAGRHLRKLERAAHSLKGSSATLGAMRLSELCRKLEDMARADTRVGVQEQVRQIEAEFTRVREALKGMRAGR
jgi:CheY-like chemotaxis protein